MKPPGCMRKLIVFIVFASVACAETSSKLPKDHPPVPAENNWRKAADLTEQLRPSGSGAASTKISRKNLIDEHIFGKMAQDGIPHAPLSSDEEFFRRIHIDLTGRIPADDQLRTFVASTDPQKREKLIDQLVTGNAYNAKWTYFFGDLAKSAANRVGNDGKNIFYRWIYDNIPLDRPYNLIVQDMLTANAASNWYV